ncbi:hypothetical protein OMAG_001957 [Candidatus Omnitrophus magneticus]|uniref:Uncharacterized protein n=1 Tax=Candidatus Omnitrophus magneticus TaxID=1609969 RepID=A0A0F0CQA8_9BACT|nr:hypothetical protein OMAG_001957 [Candidatus Omnitrophus magneticus]
MMGIWILSFLMFIMVPAIISILIFIGEQVLGHILLKPTLLLAGQWAIL